MKPKHYFTDFDEEYCHYKAYILEEMKERGLTETTISEAVRETGVDHFWCKAVDEAFLKEDGNPCSQECDGYEPRNGRNGCCKYRGFCYVPGKEYVLNINGKMTTK